MKNVIQLELILFREVILENFNSFPNSGEKLEEKQ